MEAHSTGNVYIVPKWELILLSENDSRTSQGGKWHCLPRFPNLVLEKALQFCQTDTTAGKLRFIHACHTWSLGS